jgi:hypothetical protein
MGSATPCCWCRVLAPARLGVAKFCWELRSTGCHRPRPKLDCCCGLRRWAQPGSPAARHPAWPLPCPLRLGAGCRTPDVGEGRAARATRGLGGEIGGGAVAVGGSRRFGSVGAILRGFGGGGVVWIGGEFAERGLWRRWLGWIWWVGVLSKAVSASRDGCAMSGIRWLFGPYSGEPSFKGRCGPLVGFVDMGIWRPINRNVSCETLGVWWLEGGAVDVVASVCEVVGAADCEDFPEGVVVREEEQLPGCRWVTITVARWFRSGPSRWRRRRGA